MDYRIERAQVLVAQTMARLRRVKGNVREVHGALLDLKSVQIFLADIAERPSQDVDRLRRHLVAAHCFTADTWRLELAEAEHERDHKSGILQHSPEDLWEYIEDPS